MKDIRANLPSASSFVITDACPGSENLIRSSGVSDAVEEPDEMAERGTRIHIAWQTGDTSNLAEDELDDYNKSIVILGNELSTWHDSLPVEYKGLITAKFREQRLWLNDPDTMEPLMSGQYDRLYIVGEYALIVDLKTGFCKNLMSVEINRQLRTLAVLVWKEYGVKHIRASFIKPKIYSKQVELVEFFESDLINSHALIIHSLWKSRQPDAPRVPGSHCTYCKAKSFCREAASYSMLPTVMVNAVAKPEIKELVGRMSLEDMAEVQSKAAVIRGILESINARLKSLPAEELAKVGLKVGEGRKMNPIVKTLEAFDFMAGHSLGRCSLFNALSFSKTELVKQLMIIGKSKKESEAYISEKLKPFIEEKRSEGSLEKI